jgi:ribosome-binding protein aMBF1 (putative translation factor)
MSVAVKTRHIESSTTVTRPGVILRFRSRTPARIIKHIEREYRDYLIDDDELVVWEETELARKIDTRMTPGKYLRHLRDAQGLTQQDIADKTDHRPTYISDMENDRTPISRMMARKLAKIFNVSPAVFI